MYTAFQHAIKQQQHEYNSSLAVELINAPIALQVPFFKQCIHQVLKYVIYQVKKQFQL